jgi:HTH-type transcriptional regulator/antitoxin HigA
MKTNRPAEVFPPGEFIREELESRGWTQADLAAIIDRPVQTVNMIVNGKKAITADTAQELAAALGTTPELWMNLQVAYSLSRRQPDLNKIKARARLYQTRRPSSWKQESKLEKSRR